MKMHIDEEWLKRKILEDGDECCEAGLSGLNGLLSRKQVSLKPGEPCHHPGCLNHVSHPCEGCGRIAGQGEAKVWL